MKQYRLTAPGRLDMTVDLPASKSISNRALIIHALSGGSTLPENLSDCDDTSVIIDALRTMPEEINIKAAGTAMRFMTAYLSVTPGTHILTGTERMKHRPIGILVDALRMLGANIEYIGEEGYPPIRITGSTLKGGLLEIHGNVSSQYISALLMIGPMLKDGLTLRLLDHIISRPYIDLTLWMMGEFGAEAEWTSADTITVNPKPYKSRDYFIENDWSGASYWYEILALNDDPALSGKARGLILDPDNTVYYSAVSVWEVLLKHARRPDDIPFNERDFAQACQQAGFFPLDLLKTFLALFISLPIRKGLHASGLMG